MEISHFSCMLGDLSSKGKKEMGMSLTTQKTGTSHLIVLVCLAVYKWWEYVETNQARTVKVIDSELATAGESATVACIWQRLKGRPRRGKALGVR